MNEEMMNTEVTENGNSRTILGGVIIGLAGTALGIAGKCIFDKVKDKMKEAKPEEEAPEAEEKTK